MVKWIKDQDYEYVLYGIKVDGKEAVHAMHLKKEDAIEEWEYYERLNIDRKFMEPVRTLDEILKMKEEITNQS